MGKNRICAGVMALGLASTAWGSHLSPKPQQPPAQWANYIAAVRKADTIADDEARCLAHPDLPGNNWLPDAGKWRCSVLRKPMLSLDEIGQLLQTDGQGAELDRRFAALLDANYQDQQQRDQIYKAFTVFDDSARAAEVATRWLKQSPKSAFAHAALARHYAAVGRDARGSKFVRDTPQAQLERMHKEFATAVPLYLRALEIEPRLSPACIDLAAIGRQSANELQRYAMDVCTKVDPDSYFLALERIYGAQPKWGGSDNELRLAVAYAQARVQRNPMLGALLAEGASYHLVMADKIGDVVEELAAAARMAPGGMVSFHAGRGYGVKRDPWAALVYESQALRFIPRNGDWRYARAMQLRALSDYEWAERDMQVALAIDPNDGWYQSLMGYIIIERTGEREAKPYLARPYFKRAMDFPETRMQAMVMYCQSYMPEFEASTAMADCTRDLVTEYPSQKDAWRLRAWYLAKTHSAGADQAYETFLRHADQGNARHLGEIEEIKQLLQVQESHPRPPPQ